MKQNEVASLLADIARLEMRKVRQGLNPKQRRTVLRPDAKSQRDVIRLFTALVPAHGAVKNVVSTNVMFPVAVLTPTAN